MAKAPVNNPTCVPSPEHPNRVVFIHGTSDNSTSWQKAANALSMQGFCTWAFNYGKPNDGKPNLLGRYAMVDIDDSAKEIASTIDYILSVTGAEKVDLVGHSQGGLHLKKYIAENGGDRSADTTATPNKTSMLEPVDGADVANVEVGAACKLPIPPAHAAMPQHDPTIGLILWGLTREAGDHTPTTEHCSNPARGSAGGSASGPAAGS